MDRIKALEEYVKTLEGEIEEIETGGTGAVNDVQVNGTSVVTGGIASVTVPVIDSALSSTSANGLQNKAIYNALQEKANGNARIFYGTSSTSGSTATKVVSCSDYDALTKGDILIVAFTYTNSASSAQLNVNSKGAKYVRQMRNGTLTTLLNNGALRGTCMFVYDGTYWVLQGEDSYNENAGSGTITAVKTTAGTHSAIDVTSGAANFNVPTKTSHLTNDNGFIEATGLFKVVEMRVAIPSVAAHSQYNAGSNITVPTSIRPSGMDLIGIVGIGFSNYRVVPYNWYVSSATSIALAVVNTTTTASEAANMIVHLLYSKGSKA